MAVKFDPHVTQPSAQELISYADLEEKAQQWERSPLARVCVAGRSHLNRKIFLVALSNPENLERAEHFGKINRDSWRSLVRYPSLDEPEMKRVDVAKLANNTKPVLLLHCASFGFEAAHVEAGVKFVELLLNSRTSRIKKLLDSAIILVMPMVNPDSRELAIEQWQDYPLSPGWQGMGNSYGFVMNRDFYFLSQPENRAVHQVMNDWRPIMTLDTHEDMAFLGAIRDEQCWTAPFCQPQLPDLDPRILELVKEYSGAIVENWKKRKFPLWHDENGSFFSYLILDGRFDTHFDLHGVPSLFTESARTPGTVHWQDRIDHKVEATLAFCEKASVHHKELLIDQYKYWRKQIRQPRQGPSEAYVIPRSPRRVRDEGAVNRLIEILLLHDFQVYSTEDPYPAYVVPMGQPDRAVISNMLNVERWNPLPLPPALDVECLPLEVLPAGAQRRLRLASLEPVKEIPTSNQVSPFSMPTARSPMLLPNNESNVCVVNALLKQDMDVRWLRSGERPGSFIVRDPTGLAHKTALEMGVISVEAKKSTGRSTPLSLPRIAVYMGQGADERNVSFPGEVLWALDFLGFPYVGVDEDTIFDGILKHFDVLIVPSGSALEMYSGWNTEVQNYAYPWQVPGKPKGLGKKGTRKIARFIEQGGRYIGIGSGGGAFASKEIGDLCDVTIVDHGIGQGRIYLKIKDPSHEVLFGYEGYRDQTGKWHKGIIPSIYFCDLLWPRMDTYAGPVFRAGPKAKVLATFHGIDFEEWTEYIEKPVDALLENNAAIVFEPRGEGSIVLLGISFGFRGQWHANYRLLSNALYSWSQR